jgi:alkylation response protein AidB-like acyl-CoA dehydrogenase
MESLETFRAGVREWLAENCAEDVRVGSRDRLSRTRFDDWLRALGTRGWAAPGWPTEYGGGGLDREQQEVLAEEMRAIKAPAPGGFGLNMLGPTLLELGTDEQKREHLPPICRHEIIWCQGYSEPGAGSDLAGVQTRAVLEGDEYVVTGQKIWTTLAHAAEWIFMLVRTTPKDDDQRSRYGGISCLLIPMDSEGIEVEPIPSLVGVHSFNQVFFDEVRVPVENRLGAEGEGWKVVMGALANERSGISEATGMVQHLDNLKALARRSKKNGRPALEDPSIRRRIASFETRISALRLNGMRHLTRQLQGEHPGSETSINKLLRGPLEIEMSDVAMGLLGSDAQAAGEWQKNSLSLHGVVIGGGTPNIQRNIIAERVLRLPKD